MTNTKVVNLNRSQSLIHLINPNVLYALWPRAGGKTTGGIGPRVNHLSNVMPRSQVILYSDTFERIHDRLVPNIADFLTNEMGLEPDVDFTLFKKPPDHWAKPLIPLNKFDHVISFSSGFALCCASQKVPGSANAYNAQALIVDEAKYIKEEKINTEVLPAIRGAKKHFGHLPEYRSQWYFTDKWGENIGWLLRKRRLVDPEKVKAVLTLQIEISKLSRKIEMAAATPEDHKTFAHFVKMANAIRARLVYVSEAKAYENLAAVGEQYFKDLQRDLKPIEFKIAILNEDPDTVENTFYPELDSKFHYHQLVDDYDPEKSMIIAMDYQWRITPMVVGQIGKLPGSMYNTLNILCGLDTQHPSGGIVQTLELFVRRYYTHQKKVVYYLFDHTAIGKQPGNTSFKDTVCKYLRENGWIVIEKYMHQAPDHDKKFANIKLHMGNRTEFAIKINEPECFNLIKSLSNAAAIMSGGRTKKDKRQEKNLSVPVEEATDYSDAFDQLVWGALEHKLVELTEDTPIPISFR